jgi:5'-AMP-activated protein kinase catalytic alpha subunit
VCHPHVAKLLEILETQSHVYIITEYYANGELFTYLNSNKLTEEQACKYFQELIAGVEYLHHLKIAHRNLSPENLYLDEFDNLKITNFNLGKGYKSNVLLKSFCGTPQFIAPEVPSISFIVIDYIREKV